MLADAIRSLHPNGEADPVDAATGEPSEEDRSYPPVIAPDGET